MTAVLGGETSRLAPPVAALLAFLRRLTQHPEAISGAEIRALLDSGLSADAIADAIEVCALFTIINHLADAFGLVPPSEPELAQAAAHLLAPGGYS